MAETQKELYGSIIQRYFESGKGRTLKILVVGEAGQGKSTLINALVGQEVAVEGDSFLPGTTAVQEYAFTQNHVPIRIWDTPGFGIDGDEKDEEVLETLKNISSSSRIDLTLFCVRLDAARIPTAIHRKSMAKLTEAFGNGFWKNCLFVLTFANRVVCPGGQDPNKFFSERCFNANKALKKCLAECLAKRSGEVSIELIESVRVTPVGSQKKESCGGSNPWVLPDRDDWFISFWMDVTEHIESSAVSALMQANLHRLEPLENLSCPVPSPQFEPHERLLEVPHKTLSEIKQHQSEATAAALHLESVIVETSNNAALEPPAMHHEAQASNNRFSINDNADDFTMIDKDDVERRIQWYKILQNHLLNEKSGFFSFVAGFSDLRGSKSTTGIPIVGHLGGIIEGMAIYLFSISERQAKKKIKS